VGKLKEDLLEKPFFCIPGGDECLLMLDRVYRTGKAEAHIGQDGSPEHSFYWSYAMSPVLNDDDHLLGIFIRVTEATPFHQDVIAMNQALLLGSLRQDELIERADGLNTRLQTEISIGRHTQEALVRSEKLASVGRMAAVESVIQPFYKRARNRSPRFYNDYPFESWMGFLTGNNVVVYENGRYAITLLGRDFLGWLEATGAPRKAH